MLGQLLRGALVTQLIHVAATLLRRSMLLVASGRERTAEEYRALLATAGFDVRRIIPTRSPASVVEAVPAPE